MQWAHLLVPGDYTAAQSSVSGCTHNSCIRLVVCCAHHSAYAKPTLAKSPSRAPPQPVWAMQSSNRPPPPPFMPHPTYRNIASLQTLNWGQCHQPYFHNYPKLRLILDTWSLIPWHSSEGLPSRLHAIIMCLFLSLVDRHREPLFSLLATSLREVPPLTSLGTACCRHWQHESGLTERGMASALWAGALQRPATQCWPSKVRPPPRGRGPCRARPPRAGWAGHGLRPVGGGRAMPSHPSAVPPLSQSIKS